MVSRSALAWACVLLGWACFAPSRAAAQAHALASPVAREPGRRDVYLELQAFTHLPLAVGGTMALEMGQHVVLRAGGGAVPRPYVDAINDVGTGWSLWSASDASVLRTVLTDAMFLETGAAFRTAGPVGLELSASYALLWAHVALPDATVAAMGAPASDAPRSVGLDLAVHALHVELAAVFLLGDPFPVRIALGWLHSVGRSATFAYDRADPTLDASLSAAARVMEARVDAVGFGPTLSVAVGLRL